MMNISEIPYLVPYFQAEWPGADRLRTCQDGFCVPCLLQRDLANGVIVRQAEALFWLGVAACACNTLLLLIYIILPSKNSGRTVFTTNMAVSFLLFSVACLLTRDEAAQKKTVCYDEITRATALQVRRCAFSGFLAVYGILSTRLWLILWVVQNYTKVVWQKSLFHDRQWLVTVLGHGLAIIMAAGSIRTTEHLSISFCGPRNGLPLLLFVGIPVMTLDTLSAALHLWTFVRVLTDPTMNRKSSRMRHNLSELSSFRPGQLVGSSLSMRSLLIRPFVFYTLAVLNVILMCISVCSYNSAFGDRKLQVAPSIEAMASYVQCTLDNKANRTTVDCFANLLMLKFWSAPITLLYFNMMSGIVLIFYVTRPEMFPELWNMWSRSLSRWHVGRSDRDTSMMPIEPIDPQGDNELDVVELQLSKGQYNEVVVDVMNAKVETASDIVETHIAERTDSENVTLQIWQRDYMDSLYHGRRAVRKSEIESICNDNGTSSQSQTPLQDSPLAPCDGVVGMFVTTHDQPRNDSFTAGGLADSETDILSWYESSRPVPRVVSPGPPQKPMRTSENPINSGSQPVTHSGGIDSPTMDVYDEDI